MADQDLPVEHRGERLVDGGEGRCTGDHRFIDAVDADVERAELVLGVDEARPAGLASIFREADQPDLADAPEIRVGGFDVDRDEAAHA